MNENTPNANKKDQHDDIISSSTHPIDNIGQMGFGWNLGNIFDPYPYTSSFEDRPVSFPINDFKLASQNNIKNDEMSSNIVNSGLKIKIIQPSNIQELFNQSTKFNSSKNEDKYSCDSKFYNLKQDSEHENFLETSREYNSDIEDRNDEINQVSEPKSNKDDHNQNPPSEKQKEKTPTPTFIVHKPNQNKQYKKEEGKKGLRSRVFKFSVKKLNKYIRKYLPKEFFGRKTKIHAPYTKYVGSRVTKDDDKKFWNMSFKRILVYGINRISKKNLQTKNHKNIEKIFEYIENYRKKNGKLSLGLCKIKTLLSTNTPGLIRIFVKSKYFEKYKKKVKSIVFRNGLLASEKIDVYSEEGILTLFSPIKDNLKSKRNIYGAYRKCFHAHAL